MKKKKIFGIFLGRKNENFKEYYQEAIKDLPFPFYHSFDEKFI